MKGLIKERRVVVTLILKLERLGGGHVEGKVGAVSWDGRSAFGDKGYTWMT